MIEIERVWEGVREEGLNYGLPSTFIILGPGPEFTAEELVREILVNTKCRWVCIQGEGTTRVGMGSVIKGLSSSGLMIEIEVSGEFKDPGWFTSVDRWLVDYVPNGAFNYAALRSNDMVRFYARSLEDLLVIENGFEELKIFPGTKVLVLDSSKVSEESSPAFGRAIFELIRKYERVRVYSQWRA